jgi:hypothetical protein
MVISDKYRYVFVELPRTGSTAVSRELRELYDGRGILHKHASYQEFLNWANDEQKSYFAFGGIRNPLDDAVSLYFKLLDDHKKSYSGIKNAGWFTRAVYAFRSRQFRFAQEEKTGFSRFFLRFYRWPYDNWSCLSHPRLDFILRFERLADDFASAISGVGTTPLRPLPVQNKTANRKMHFSEYYDAEAISRAKWVFGVYMRKWNYEFPAHWGVGGIEPGRWNKQTYNFLNFFRVFYWRYLRPVVYARTVRERRAQRKSTASERIG